MDFQSKKVLESLNLGFFNGRLSLFCSWYHIAMVHVMVEPEMFCQDRKCSVNPGGDI